MRHDDHGHARPGEVAHDLEHLADELGIERRGRLVEEHEFRPHGKGAGDRDALLLAARELDRVGVALVGEPDPLEERQRLVASRRWRFCTVIGPSVMF